MGARQLVDVITPDSRYLSPNHAVPYMSMTAMTYGGAPRDCEAANPKPRVSFRMMGRKKANEYVTVVQQLTRLVRICSTLPPGEFWTYKKISANPQISISLAGLR